MRAETEEAEQGAIVVVDSDENDAPTSPPPRPAGTRDDPIVL